MSVIFDYFSNWKPFKNDEDCFLIISFRSDDIYVYDFRIAEKEPLSTNEANDVSKSYRQIKQMT